MENDMFGNKSISKLILGTVQLGMPYGLRENSAPPGKKEAFDMLNTAYL